MDIEEDEPEEEPIEEPELLVGHEDQFDAHPNPPPGNMNGWLDDDDDVEEEEEDEENKDADIEEDDDAEIIFPYEVVEKLKVLENEENATLRKKLAKKEVLLDLTRMERDRAERRIMPPKQMSEARMREIIRDQFATSMNEFMANMNSGAGGPGG
nr:hypothetical protein [Tanacetum cinerariifolium]